MDMVWEALETGKVGGVIPPDSEASIRSHPLVTGVNRNESSKAWFEVICRLHQIAVSEFNANTDVPFGRADTLTDNGKVGDKRVCYQTHLNGF